MQFFNIFKVLLIVLAALHLQVVSAQDKANNRQPSIPLNNGLQALSEGKLLEADRWFGITARDFPDRLDGLRAMSLQLMIYGAHELSNLRLARYLHERAGLELKNRDKWQKRSEVYEKQAVEWGEKMVERGIEFLKHDKPLPLKLEFSLGLDGLDIETLRSRLARGDFLDTREMEQLLRGEWLRNFVGYLREVLQVEAGEVDFSGRYSGKLDRPALYRALGVRYYIVGSKAKSAESIALARDYFKKVMQLTENEPYDHDRQQAIDFLARLEDLNKPESAQAIEQSKEGKK